ncbi:MAG: helix-turn-helix domain-containing protein [Halobaculum sp.]
MHRASRSDRDRVGARPTGERLQWSSIARFRSVRSVDDVATTVVATLERALDDPFVYVFTRGDDHGRLEPTARSTRELADVPLLDEGPVWEAFVEGREHWTETDDAATCELAVPLGVHGVVLVGYADRPGFTPDEEELVGTVATTAEWRLDAIEARARVDAAERERDRAVARERETERDHEALHGFVRDVVDAESRRAVETALVDRLVGLSAVDAATVVETSSAGDLRTVRARGDPLVPLPTDGSTRETPLHETLTTGVAQTVPDVFAFDGDASWRRRVLDAGHQSTAVLPLRRGTGVDGAVELFAASVDAFDRPSVVDGMVGLAAAAIATFERRESTLAGRDCEVVFALADSSDPLFALARSAETTLTLRELVARTDGAVQFSFESETPLEVATLRRRSDVVDVERVGGGDPRYVAEVARSALLDVLIDEGVALDRVAVEDGAGRLAMRVSAATDVRRLLERCSLGGDATLVRKTSVSTRDGDRPGGSPTDALTARQREVIGTAHRGGFFDWPRGHTGEEIAAELGIAPSTFHQHVRTGTSRLFDALFG